MNCTITYLPMTLVGLHVISVAPPEATFPRPHGYFETSGASPVGWDRVTETRKRSVSPVYNKNHKITQHVTLS